MKKLTYLAILIIFVLPGCTKDYTKINDKEIRKYLEENDLEADMHESGIYYNIPVEGNGVRPDVLSTVRVIYKGYMTNGAVFDQTPEGDTSEFFLDDMIHGWKIVVPMLKGGGKGTFYIPSEYGYGEYDVGFIPANSVLIFDIELIDSWH